MFVTILDRNDNSPKFSQVSYIGSIMENSRPGTTVDMVSAYRETTSETTTTEVATVVYKQNIYNPQETNWKTRVELFRSEKFSIECCKSKSDHCC